MNGDPEEAGVGAGGTRSAGIEVGAAGNLGTLRFELAKHAIRHGELRLASQVASLNGLQSRATQIMSWSIAGATALVAAAATTDWRWPAGATAGALLLTALFCLGALWPRTWNAPGYDPRTIMAEPLGTELEALESVGFGYSDGIRANAARLERAVNLLRCAWVLLVASPLLGLLALAFTGG